MLQMKRISMIFVRLQDEEIEVQLAILILFTSQIIDQSRENEEGTHNE